MLRYRLGNQLGILRLRKKIRSIETEFAQNGL